MYYTIYSLNMLSFIMLVLFYVDKLSFNCIFLYFQDFILEHYSEDGTQYEKEIQELCDLRQVN